MANKEQHRGRRDHKKPKKVRPAEQINPHHSSFVEQINSNETPHVKP